MSIIKKAPASVKRHAIWVTLMNAKAQPPSIRASPSTIGPTPNAPSPVATTPQKSLDELPTTDRKTKGDPDYYARNIAIEAQAEIGTTAPRQQLTRDGSVPTSPAANS